MGPVGALTKVAGKNFAWMGAWIVFVSTAIMFYYSVVTGWCIRYFFSAASGNLFNTSEHLLIGMNSASGYQPLVISFLCNSICRNSNSERRY